MCKQEKENKRTRMRKQDNKNKKTKATRTRTNKNQSKKTRQQEQEFGSVLRSMFHSPKTGSGRPLESFSFREGMQSFCEHMVDYLGRDNFVFSADISSVSSAEPGWRIDLARSSTAF